MVRAHWQGLSKSMPGRLQDIRQLLIGAAVLTALVVLAVFASQPAQNGYYFDAGQQRWVSDGAAMNCPATSPECAPPHAVF